MIKSFLKFTLCSFFITTWVLSVPALHLEPRARVCSGLINTRSGKGNKFCSNPNNIFTYETGAQARIGGSVSPSGLTCDHLLELTLVNNAIEVNLCGPLLADRSKTVQEKKAALVPIVRAANNIDNNMFLVTSAVENFKGDRYQDFFLRGTLHIGGNDLALAQAVEDYLTKTRSKSIGTANAIDEAIAAVIAQNGYPSRTDSRNVVSTGWSNFLTVYSSTVSDLVASNSPAATTTTSGAPPAVTPQVVFPQPAAPEPASPEPTPLQPVSPK